MKILFLFLFSMFLYASHPTSCYIELKRVLTGDDLGHSLILNRFNKYSELKFSPLNANRIKRNYHALFFIDYQHYIREFVEALDDTDSFFTKLYYRTGYGKAPLDNFITARKYLYKSRPDVSIASINKTHTLASKGLMHKKWLGKIRSYSMEGWEEEGISYQVFKVIERNPYLTFEVDQKLKGGLLKGRIQYPSLENASDEAIHRAEMIFQGIGEQIQEYRIGKYTNYEQTYQNFITALVEERLRWFVFQKDQIGKLDNAPKIRRYVRTVAQLHRDLVSIHPYGDGNGRTIRLFVLDYLLADMELYPSRIVNTNNDLYLPIERWSNEVIRGSLSTKRLLRDLTDRLDNDLYLYDSPYLIDPYYNPYHRIYSKNGTRKRGEDFKIIRIGEDQFLPFFVELLKDGQFSIDEFEKMPVVTLRKINKKFEQEMSKNNLIFYHDKEGIQDLGLRYITRGYEHSFYNTSFNNIKKWNSKMDRWYLKDKIIWRGMSRNRSPSKREMVSLFKKIHWQMVSNNILYNMPQKYTKSWLNTSIHNEFKRFNESVYNSTISYWATHHQCELKDYDKSFFLSASEKWATAKSFAQWAQGDDVFYGVIIGYRQSKSDIRVNRLKQLREEFSSKYPRQREVLTPGAVDPDAISVAQVVNQKGRILHSYIRDPSNPSQVLIFKGKVYLDNIKESSKKLLEIVPLI